MKWRTNIWRISRCCEYTSYWWHYKGSNGEKGLQRGWPLQIIIFENTFSKFVHDQVVPTSRRWVGMTSSHLRTMWSQTVLPAVFSTVKKKSRWYVKFVSNGSEKIFSCSRFILSGSLYFWQNKDRRQKKWIVRFSSSCISVLWRVGQTSYERKFLSSYYITRDIVSKYFTAHELYLTIWYI